MWIGAAALCSAGIATSGSRATVLGLAVVTMVYVVAAFFDRQRYLPAAAAASLPFLAIAAMISDIWLPRLQQTLSGSANARSAGRLTQISDAIAIAVDNPIVGVGPGRTAFVGEAQFRHHYGETVWSVHFTPMLAAAELGIVTGLAYVGYLLALAWRVLKTSPEAIALVVAVGVWMPLDKLAYSHPTAIILVGVWAVGLDQLARRRHEPVIEPAKSSGTVG